MKHDPDAFEMASSRRVAVSRAYGGNVEERVRRFMPMVRRLAWHVHGSGRPGIEIGDLMQAGLVALTECAQRHKGPGEDGFAAYAKMRVRGAMVDLVRKEAPTSRGASRRRREIAASESALHARLGRPPGEDELAAELGLTVADLAAQRHASQPLRFESISEIYDDADTAFADDTPDSFETLADGETREMLVAAIADLPERLQLVIQLYFVEELNLSEIAEVLSVSIPRVHQLKAQALSKLGDALADVATII